MNALSEHQERKQRLIEWYRIIQGEPELFELDNEENEFGIASLQNAQRNLEEERFIVAICGQMNSGKSTLLNALMFENETLPMSPTTMTAKITLMKGGDPETIKATLYTQDEFESVIEASRKSGRFAFEELEDARIGARNAGFVESELLKCPPRIEERMGLESLLEFVGVPDDGGTLTPYVNQVEITADRPWLFEVTVADTPGTNDPNPQRDKLTREWITRADAVVYVTYAGQAGMDEYDVAFLDDNLSHIDPRKRLIAVNKIDILNQQHASNLEEIVNHMRTLNKSDSLRGRDLFAEEDDIIPVSGLGALLSAMNSSGGVMSESLRANLLFFERNGWLESENNGIVRLREKIERRIISVKGNSIILSHRRRIANVFERAQRTIELRKNEAGAMIEMLSANREARREEIDLIGAAILSINQCQNDSGTETKNRLDCAMEELNEVAGMISANVVEKIKRELQGKNIGEITSLWPWQLQKAFGREIRRIVDPIKESFRTLEGSMNQMEQKFSNLLAESKLGNRYTPRHLLPIRAHSIIRDIETELYNDLERSGISNQIKQAVPWLKRVFGTKGGKEECLIALEGKLGPLVTESLKQLLDRANDKLENEVENAIRSLTENTTIILDNRKKFLEELKETFVNADKEKDRLKAQIRDNDEQLAKINVEAMKFRKDVPPL